LVSHENAAVFRQNDYVIEAAMENAKQPDFRFANHIKKTVRKTVKIQTPHIGKADSIKRGILRQRLDVLLEVALEFRPEAGTLVFIPVIGVLQIKPQKRMSFERAHRRIHGTSVPRRIA